MFGRSGSNRKHYPWIKGEEETGVHYNYIKMLSQLDSKSQVQASKHALESAQELS